MTLCTCTLDRLNDTQCPAHPSIPWIRSQGDVVLQAVDRAFAKVDDAGEHLAMSLDP